MIYRDPNAYPTQESNPTNAPYHLGLDIFDFSGESGNTPVYAVYDGWANRASFSAIEIEHVLDEGQWSAKVPYLHVWTYYTHMGSGNQAFIDLINPKTGNTIQMEDAPVWVQKGQQIGRIGNYHTPNPHLHFSIKWNSDSELKKENVVDPSDYLGSDLDFKGGAKPTKSSIACRQMPPPPPPKVVVQTTTFFQIFPWWKSFYYLNSRVFKIQLDGKTIADRSPDTNTPGNYAATHFIWWPGTHTVQWFYYDDPTQSTSSRAPNIINSAGLPDVKISEWPNILTFLGGYTEDPPLPPPSDPVPPPADGPKLIPSDGATFVSDVTIPDGTIMSPGQSFVKTWRMRNTGTVSWDSNYKWVFVTGNQFSAPAAIAVPYASSGNTVDINVSMIAPSGPGSYIGYWQIRNPQGSLIGDIAWVQINVATEAGPTLTPTTSPPAPSPTPFTGLFAPTEVKVFGIDGQNVRLSSD